MHSWGLEVAASCSVTAAVPTTGEIICMRHAWNSCRMAHGSATCTPRAESCCGGAGDAQLELHILDRKNAHAHSFTACQLLVEVHAADMLAWLSAVELQKALPHALHLTEQFSSAATAAANCARSAARESAASPGWFSMSVLKLIWMLCCAASCHATASLIVKCTPTLCRSGYHKLKLHK